MVVLVEHKALTRGVEKGRLLVIFHEGGTFGEEGVRTGAGCDGDTGAVSCSDAGRARDELRDGLG